MKFSFTEEQEEFRSVLRRFLEDRSPTKEVRRLMATPDGWERDQWAKINSELGLTALAIPESYGGHGFGLSEQCIMMEEMGRSLLCAPYFGSAVLAANAILYSGTEEQKKLHIPGIASGDVSWCQGYSEPGAGSDLASLRTKAEDKGDFFEVNGQKIWTSGAQFADWIFALVRTDFDVPKHEGISFVLMDMSQAGVSIKPIKLISGSSPFCETFFDNAIAQKTDLVGQLNRGWTVGKRLLQHERSGQGGLGQAGARRVVPEPKLAEVAKQYVGVDSTGKIADSQARREVTQFAMDRASFKLTQKRAREENESGQTMGEATSIFKLVGASWSRDTSDLLCKLRGSQGYGWEGEGFDKKEIESTRDFLSARAHTIYGGTNEVQLNIIAKRVLGLPE